MKGIGFTTEDSEDHEDRMTLILDLKDEVRKAGKQGDQRWQIQHKFYKKCCASKLDVQAGGSYSGG